MASKDRVIKATAGYIIGNYLLKGITFLSIPIFARLLETEDYGVYNTFIAYEGILFVLVGMAIHSSYKNANLKYGTDQEYGYSKYRSDTLMLVIFTALLYCVALNVFYNIVARYTFFTRFEANLLVIYAFSSAIIVCFNTDVGIRYEFKQFLKVAGINAISNILLSVVLITLAFKDMRYEGRILGTTIPAFFLAICIVISYLRKEKPAFNKKEIKWGLQYSLPIIPHGISQRILSQFDQIMITNMINTSATGLYGFAGNVSLIFSVTFQSVDTVWSQWFYDCKKNNNLKGIRDFSAYYVMMMFALACALMFAAPEIITIIGSKKYADSIYCVPPLVAGSFFTFLYSLPSVAEYYFEKTKSIAFATSVAALLNIGLNYIFIPKFGYVAAAYTTLMTYMIYFIFHCYMAYRIEHSISYSWKTVLTCATLVLAAIPISETLIPYMAIRWMIVLLALGCATYFALTKLGFSERVRKKIKH